MYHGTKYDVVVETAEEIGTDGKVRPDDEERSWHKRANSGYTVGMNLHWSGGYDNVEASAVGTMAGAGESPPLGRVADAKHSLADGDYYCGYVSDPGFGYIFAELHACLAAALILVLAAGLPVPVAGPWHDLRQAFG